MAAQQLGLLVKSWTSNVKTQMRSQAQKIGMFSVLVGLFALSSNAMADSSTACMRGDVFLRGLQPFTVPMSSDDKLTLEPWNQQNRMAVNKFNLGEAFTIYQVADARSERWLKQNRLTRLLFRPWKAKAPIQVDFSHVAYNPGDRITGCPDGGKTSCVGRAISFGTAKVDLSFAFSVDEARRIRGLFTSFGPEQKCEPEADFPFEDKDDLRAFLDGLLGKVKAP
jgi:hypothetical protein